jgi:hypothetical protein
MTQKTRSLALLGGLLLVLGILVLLWRSITPSEAQRIIPEQQPATQQQQVSISSESGVVSSSSTPVSAISTTILPTVATSSAPVSTDISLLVVGDIMLDRNVAARTKKSGNPRYPFLQLPADWVSGVDFALANLEGPVTPVRRPPVKSIDFQFDPAWTAVLKSEGWDGFSQANNHALDQGSAGYADSVSRLRQAGFVTFGHQVDDGLIALATTTIKGERLAFLGWNNTDNPVNRVQAAGAIATAKAESDLVIAYLHWGNEYRDRPDAQNVELAHWLIDQGVDLVIGGHPHWVQGFSSYKGKPIVWSLGNFVFDQDWSKETQQGLAIELSITPEAIRILPVPLSIKVSQPKKEVGTILAARLEALAKISDSELQQVIKEGKELVFTRDN